ncbi:hypothetical protein CY34DRAFT_805121 [Suillus luteus UH-Slu-Lm8-n1]|uniref:Uncharacterized protein n=1 Tax=Suillus luteus UH-Slu-Lm8-n1 TaxID=930992 RepID=A0A0C9ZWV7_9AGAM|nr:hypothetical protein CY34DRAFT_805121 [Suillus luteus UH-Slu-Lm8-n1]
MLEVDDVIPGCSGIALRGDGGTICSPAPKLIQELGRVPVSPTVVVLHVSMQCETPSTGSEWWPAAFWTEVWLTWS